MLGKKPDRRKEVECFRAHIVAILDGTTIHSMINYAILEAETRLDVIKVA